MDYPKLPKVKEQVLDLPHFPTRFHAAVFRLWETVPASRIAFALGIPEEDVVSAASNMGLPPQKYNENWRTRGYITTIRNAWHLLPYENLLRLLDMSEDELATVLKEDDFLEWKLGGFKPYCPPITKEELDGEGRRKLGKIKEAVRTNFSDLFLGDEPFKFFSESSFEGAPKVRSDDGIRLIYSYCGLYASALERDVSVSYPDELLSRYAESGVNAIWIPAVLYQLVPFPFDESYSAGYEKRRERLCALIEHAARFGIKVYLYLNEPRCMPLGFFEEHKDLLGATTTYNGALCTSDKRTLDYLDCAVKELCGSVRGLGGIFLITASENLTHCKSKFKEGTVCHCERCKDIPPSKLISGVINVIASAAWSVDPDLKIIAWTWAWDSLMNEEEISECIKSLPKDVIIQCNSEAQMPYEIAGVKGTVRDYSMSLPGPGDLARSVWKCAKENGHDAMAKVQVNVTWECSTLPYLPVFDLIREHMTGLKSEGVDHLMLSWTLGGYPSVNLRVATECLLDPSDEHYDALLSELFRSNAKTVKRAASAFSLAFREFPFHINTLYRGPQNPGPSNLLYPSPSGFASTMTCYSYDDLDSWRSIYPRGVYIDQLKKLSEKWLVGLEIIKDMPCDDLFKMCAEGAYLLFRSSYLQSLFVKVREDGDKALMVKIAQEERTNALSMYKLMKQCALFGYEAANHYYFNKGMLMEKVINCDHVMERLENS